MLILIWHEHAHSTHCVNHSLSESSRSRRKRAKRGEKHRNSSHRTSHSTASQRSGAIASFHELLGSNVPTDSHPMCVCLCRPHPPFHLTASLAVRSTVPATLPPCCTARRIPGFTNIAGLRYRFLSHLLFQGSALVPAMAVEPKRRPRCHRSFSSSRQLQVPRLNFRICAFVSGCFFFDSFLRIDILLRH